MALLIKFYTQIKKASIFLLNDLFAIDAINMGS